MTFLLSVLRPSGFDLAASVTPEMRENIDAVNDQMEAAGVRRFVGGLQPPATARTFEPGASGEAQESPNLTAGHYLDGLWVIEVGSAEEAHAWAQKAALACRAQVEARPFH